jgi:hypothetical protein
LATELKQPEMAMLKLKETKATNESAERLRLRSAVEAIAKRLSDHCGKVRALVNGLEVTQINNAKFSLDRPFYSTKSSLTMNAIKNMVKTYESLRRDVREIAQIGYVEFENSFPELDINFETYYSVAFSLLNLNYQMQLMRLYCCRLLKS